MLNKLSIIIICYFLFFSFTNQLQVEILIELFMKSYNLLIVKISSGEWENSFLSSEEKKERFLNGTITYVFILQTDN